MKLSKIIKLLMGVTCLALIYTHLQIQIFDLAYRGKKKEKDIISISDENGRVVSKILKLKSANNIGTSFLVKDSSLCFKDQTRSVKLTRDEVPVQAASMASIMIKKENPLIKFFSLKSQAEARPVQEADLAKPWRRKNSYRNYNLW